MTGTYPGESQRKNRPQYCSQGLETVKHHLKPTGEPASPRSYGDLGVDIPDSIVRRPDLRV